MYDTPTITANTLNGIVKQLAKFYLDNHNVKSITKATKEIKRQYKSKSFESLLDMYDGTYTGKFPATINQFTNWKAKDCKFTQHHPTYI